MSRKRSKQYKNSINLIDKNKKYSIKEAIELVKKTSFVKFNATINLSMHLGIKLNQLIKCNVILPHGTGKIKKILAITNNQMNEAKNAGADFVGNKDMIDKIINENWFNYDVIVATPDMMAEIGKIGHILGPKGLMPNPKNGTVSTNIKQSIEEIKSGKINFCSDKNNNINIGFAKCSFSNEAIEDNFKAVFDCIVKNRPVALKGNYINNVYINVTMGPSIKVLIQ